MQSDFQGLRRFFFLNQWLFLWAIFAVLVALEQITQGPKFQMCLLIEQHFPEPPMESESRPGRLDQSFSLSLCGANAEKQHL